MATIVQNICVFKMTRKIATSIRLPLELRKAIKILALEKDITESEVIRDLLLNGIKKRRKSV